MSDVPGYDLDDTLLVDTTEQHKALADPVRRLVIDLVLERAMTVTELAALVGRSKGTVAHHVDVLVAAGLLKVVSTRRVRAIEERCYGRTARTYVFPGSTSGDDLPFADEARACWDRAADAGPAEVGGFTLRRARVPAERAAEFWARFEALTVEFTKAERSGDREYAVYVGVFPTVRRMAPTPKGRRRAP